MSTKAQNVTHPARLPSGRAPSGGRHRCPRHRPSSAPGNGRHLGICGWATALGVVALASALRGLASVVAGTTPQWYQPVTAALGLGAIGLGMLALHRRVRPTWAWTALALANVAVGVSAGLTVSLP